MDQSTSAIIEVAVEEGSWNQAVTGIDEFCGRIVNAALNGSGVALKPNGEISLLLTDDAQLRTLNEQYRGQDKPTNVLAFPGDSPGQAALGDAWLIGDIALAFQTLEREALEQAKPFSAHMAHLLIHGTLHLLGFDHDTDEQANHMEQTEIRIMNDLGYPDPYAILGEAV